MHLVTRTKVSLIAAALVILIGVYFIFVRSISIGAWTHGLWNKETKTVHPEVLKKFEETIGKKMAIAHIYVGWGELENRRVVQTLNTLDKNGWKPMVSVNPYFFDGCKTAGVSLYRTIAEGFCDRFLSRAAKNLKHVNAPFYLRFAWEMNIKTNEWSVPYSQSTPEEFVAAWKHMHTILAEQNDNIIWVFCPNVKNGNTIGFEDLYPGDEYVDWTCLDGYNWGTTQSWSTWQNFNDVFYESYRTMTKLASGKPVMIGEVNSAVQGGDKSAWFRDMLAVQIPFRYPQVKAIVFYNEDRTVPEGVDWRLEKDTASLEAFRFWIRLPLYNKN